MATILLAGLIYDLEASICRALARQGHATLAALDTPQLLQAVWEAHPDLVILDPDTLVGRNGAHICSELQELSTWHSTFMIVISGRNEVRDRVDALAAGADDYVAIPFYMPELLLRVEALLRRQARLRRPQAAADTVRRGDMGQVWTQSPGCGDSSSMRVQIRHLLEKLAELTQQFLIKFENTQGQNYVMIGT